MPGVSRGEEEEQGTEGGALSGHYWTPQAAVNQGQSLTGARQGRWAGPTPALRKFKRTETNVPEPGCAAGPSPSIAGSDSFSSFRPLITNLCY
ncbi:hypothetical protein JZ751_022350 [Albula glossodonta]|uniref:Uncharacterized protein n=1 Tax=Albula glossodonta TaxID=121402 RepID=A0A8T2NU29_9TELE|nr:hypothetical protein JZ751_022350 [Albula glossodonta]